MESFEYYCEEFQKAANAEVEALQEMEQAKVTLEVIGLKIELAVIQSHGNDEKKVGSTETARKRTYDLARMDNSAFQRAQENYLSTKIHHKYSQYMLQLQKISLQFLSQYRSN